MNINVLKSAIVGLVLMLSGLANAGVITYTGPTGSGVDTKPASLFEITITDNYLISDLNIQLELTNVENLYWTDLDLSFSNGVTSVLMAASQANDSFGLFNVIFDDEALTELPTANDALGSFQSFESLSAFDGQSINGTWTLSILDEYFPGDLNQLTSYSIIATSVPEPTSLAILALSIMGLVARRFKKQ